MYCFCALWLLLYSVRLCVVVYGDLFGCLLWLFWCFGVLGVFYLGGVVDVGLLVLLAFVLGVALWICCFGYVSLV